MVMVTKIEVTDNMKIFNEPKILYYLYKTSFPLMITSYILLLLIESFWIKSESITPVAKFPFATIFIVLPIYLLLLSMIFLSFNKFVHRIFIDDNEKLIIFFQYMKKDPLVIEFKDINCFLIGLNFFSFKILNGKLLHFRGDFNLYKEIFKIGVDTKWSSIAKFINKKEYNEYVTFLQNHSDS